MKGEVGKPKGFILPAPVKSIDLNANHKST